MPFSVGCGVSLSSVSDSRKSSSWPGPEKKRRRKAVLRAVSVATSRDLSSRARKSRISSSVRIPSYAGGCECCKGWLVDGSMDPTRVDEQAKNSADPCTVAVRMTFGFWVRSRRGSRLRNLTSYDSHDTLTPRPYLRAIRTQWRLEAMFSADTRSSLGL